MSKFTLGKIEVSLDDSWDVIVAGGGPSGCAAAIAAAREGAKTLLIEATGSLGGMATSGLVSSWCPFSDGEKVIYKGLAEKVFNASKKATPYVGASQLDWVPLDPESLKRIYDDMVSDADVSILFHTMLAGVETEKDGKVSAVILAGKAGLSAYRAKVYVDCTGDGDLAAWAGAMYEKGDTSGELQPSTLCFILSNVDTENYRNGPSLYAGNPESPIWEILKSKKYPLIPDEHICQNLIGPGTVGFNAGHIWDVDNTDPKSVSKAMIKGRRIAKSIRDALTEYAPAAFGDAHLTATAPLMGIRESRCIIGDYVLTLGDYRARRSFPDEIARNCYLIDIHLTKAESQSSISLRTGNEAQRERYRTGESHGIPYRCLIPKGIDNVLVAGRCISTDHTVQGSTRVMPVCLVTGEAAGVAAAMAASGSGNTHSVCVEELRNKLKGYGAYLP